MNTTYYYANERKENMTVFVQKNESLDSALRRFKKMTEKAGITSEYRSKMAYISRKETKRDKARLKNHKRAKRQK